MAVMEREYNDSFEENKNGIMALRKAMDLGGKYKLTLQDGANISVASAVAAAIHEKLMGYKAPDRAVIAEKMMGSRETFIVVAKELLK